MAKSLSDRIAERARSKKPSRGAQNRATVLALRADIKLALEDGWPVKSVWATLHDEGKVTFSYQAFRGYVNRLIPTISVQPTPAPAPRLGTPAAPPRPHHPSPGGFTFSSAPNKEDLL